MGRVFLAEQIHVGGRRVALKVVHRRLLENPEFRLRFRNEAASTGRIRHHNVVTVYESGEGDDGTPYLAMEFLDGETLRNRIRRLGALPPDDVVDIVRQVARALQAAHSVGIIHRDVKPDNIFLTADEEGRTVAKVTDFGLAKLQESTVHTDTGFLCGTPAYMSAEQASGMRSDQLDARSDVYSLGIVAYELLTGRVPFASDTPLGYIRQHVAAPLPPFFEVNPGIDAPAIEEVVRRALEKDRDRRYSSALEFSQALAAARVGSSAPAPAASSGVSTIVDTPPLQPQAPRAATSPRIDPSAALSSSASLSPPAEPDSRVELPTEHATARPRRGVKGFATVATLIALFAVGSGAYYLYQRSLTRAGIANLQSRCDQGESNACHTLANAYLTGDGVSIDAERSNSLMARSVDIDRRACEAGDGFGCWALGLSYEHGTRVSHDSDLSITFYRRACTLDYKAGCDELIRLGQQIAPAMSGPTVAAPPNGGLSPGSIVPPSDATPESAAPGAISGRAVDAAGTRIPAFVMLRQKTTRTAETYSSLFTGFDFSALTPGVYVLEASTPTEEISRRFTIAAGQTETVTLKFGKTRLTGQAKTSGDGTFRIDLPTGGYSVHVEAAGFQQDMISTRVENDRGPILRSRLEPGRPRWTPMSWQPSSLDGPGGAITGTVTDKQGRPVDGAIVSAFRVTPQK